MIWSTKDVSEITGASLRQLQWYDEQGYLATPLRGHSRVWDQEALRRVIVLKRIRDGGSNFHPSLKRLKNSILSLRYLLFYRPRPWGSVQLCAASDDPADIIRIATASKDGVLLVELPPLMDPLEKR